MLANHFEILSMYMNQIRWVRAVFTCAHNNKNGYFVSILMCIFTDVIPYTDLAASPLTYTHKHHCRLYTDGRIRKKCMIFTSHARIITIITISTMWLNDAIRRVSFAKIVHFYCSDTQSQNIKLLQYFPWSKCKIVWRKVYCLVKLNVVCKSWSSLCREKLAWNLFNYFQKIEKEKTLLKNHKLIKKNYVAIKYNRNEYIEYAIELYANFNRNKHRSTRLPSTIEFIESKKKESKMVFMLNRAFSLTQEDFSSETWNYVCSCILRNWNFQKC